LSALGLERIIRRKRIDRAATEAHGGGVEKED
jgi:hypothetical protein